MIETTLGDATNRPNVRRLASSTSREYRGLGHGRSGALETNGRPPLPLALLVVDEFIWRRRKCDCVVGAARVARPVIGATDRTDPLHARRVPARVAWRIIRRGTALCCSGRGEVGRVRGEERIRLRAGGSTEGRTARDQLGQGVEYDREVATEESRQAASRRVWPARRERTQSSQSMTDSGQKTTPTTTDGHRPREGRRGTDREMERINNKLVSASPGLVVGPSTSCEVHHAQKSRCGAHPHHPWHACSLRCGSASESTPSRSRSKRSDEKLRK